MARTTTSALIVKFSELRVADVSSAHLGPVDQRLIGDANTPGVALAGHFGALVYLASEHGFADRSDAGHTEGFLHLLTMAAHQGYTHIRFDADGPMIRGLPIFEGPGSNPPR
jgi:hypothetical protein